MTESNRIEYKQQLTDGLEREVVAFLNTHEGGIIWLGIDKVDKRECFRFTGNFLRMTMPNAVVKNIEDDSSTGGRIGGPIKDENGDSMGDSMGDSEGGQIGGQIPLTTKQKQICCV
jgi:hypothetical protein